MSAEAAFLETLKATPADDTARLVYADWLDEHGRAREAEYLRLVVALTRTCEDATHEQPEVARLCYLAESLPLDWREDAASRFRVILHAWSEAVNKVEVIKSIREVSGMTLAAAKHASEQLPSLLLDCTPFEQALSARDRVCRVMTTRVLIHPSDPETLPFSVSYTIVATRSVQVATGAWAPVDTRSATAFVTFLRAALNITKADAQKLARRGEVVVGANMDRATARRHIAKLRDHLPADDSDAGWRIVLALRATCTPKTPE
jgi:uncharacterized protein (TIGR02996 family)